MKRQGKQKELQNVKRETNIIFPINFSKITPMFHKTIHGSDHIIHQRTRGKTKLFENYVVPSLPCVLQEAIVNSKEDLSLLAQLAVK